MSDRLAAALVELVDAIRAEVRAELEADRTAPERLLSVDEARKMLGIGRSAFYAELMGGRVRSLTLGRRRLIPAAAIAEYIAGRATPS